MACFIVPTGEAIVVALADKIVKEREKNSPEKATGETTGVAQHVWTKKLGWLTRMLAGGSVLLAFEHVWHGEVVPYFPFLTAMYSPSDTAEMLHEMATVGTTMALIITAVWVGMVIVSGVIEKRTVESEVSDS
ncbi:MAG: hypothetical protein K6G23_10185 [Lachnospiraceae bacterium]|nr:hypothetical protein [Lachnospiraceae bacterium]